MWYGGGAGEGLRSDGVDDLPLSKSECSILPIARRLSDRGFRVPALSLAALLSDLTEGAAFALPRLLHTLVTASNGRGEVSVKFR